MVIRKKEVGIGLIGAGKIGSLRAHLAATSPVVNFFAISDIDPQRARGRGPAERGGLSYLGQP